MVLAALGGSSGKTTVSLGLVSAWRRSGKKVVPFKKGPDFIDAGWLAGAAAHSCFNLDPYLMDSDSILKSYLSQSINADAVVIEGNRGLYDGVDVEGAYSTAELAKLLSAPVILILNITKMTRTAAALVLGCQKMDPDVRIKGVILNRVGTGRQESLIRAAIEKYCGIPVVGAVPRLKGEFFPERHMGLIPAEEHPGVDASLEAAARVSEKYLDLESIWSISSDIKPFGLEVQSMPPAKQDAAGLKVGIIRDSAFQFYYPENFTGFEARGAELVTVNAVTDRELPTLDVLYIGGGFPETHAVALAQNRSFRESLKKAVEAGLPIYAECGGLMYLGRSLEMAGKTYPMSGVLPLEFELHKRPRGHGYTNIVVDTENPFFPVGTTLKGHEFHYSSVKGTIPGNITTAFKLKRGTGISNSRDGVIYKNIMAAYTHLHALASPQWVDALIERGRAYRQDRSRL